MSDINLNPELDWTDLHKENDTLRAQLEIAVEALKSLLNNHFLYLNSPDVVKAREALSKIQAEKGE